RLVRVVREGRRPFQFRLRRGRDSNPRYVAAHLISNQAPSTTRTPLLGGGDSVSSRAACQRRNGGTEVTDEARADRRRSSPVLWDQPCWSFSGPSDGYWLPPTEAAPFAAPVEVPGEWGILPTWMRSPRYERPSPDSTCEKLAEALDLMRWHPTSASQTPPSSTLTTLTSKSIGDCATGFSAMTEVTDVELALQRV